MVEKDISYQLETIRNDLYVITTFICFMIPAIITFILSIMNNYEKGAYFGFYLIIAGGLASTIISIVFNIDTKKRYEVKKCQKK